MHVSPHEYWPFAFLLVECWGLFYPEPTEIVRDVASEDCWAGGLRPVLV